MTDAPFEGPAYLCRRDVLRNNNYYAYVFENLWRIKTQYFNSTNDIMKTHVVVCFLGVTTLLAVISTAP